MDAEGSPSDEFLVSPVKSSNGRHPESAEPASRTGDAERPTSGDPPADPLAPLIAHFAELREYLTIYAATWFDHYRLAARSILFWLVPAFVAAVVAAVTLITATALLLNGAADG